MNKQTRWIGFLVMMLALASLSCGLFAGDEEQPAAEPTAAVPVEEPAEPADEAAEETTTDEETAAAEQPAEEPAEEATTAPAEEAEEAPETTAGETLLLDTISTSFDFESYQFQLDMDITSVDDSGAEIAQSINANITFTSDPPATSIIMSLEGLEDIVEELGTETAQISMAQLEDINYMVVPGLGCITLPANEALDNPFAELAEPDNFLEEIEDAEYVGEDVINSIEVNHYRFTRDNLRTDSVDGVEELSGDVYIAKDGMYLVRMVMEGSGEVGDIVDTGTPQNGDIYLEMNLTSINDPSLTVAIPEECSEAEGGTADYPVLEDATELASMGGLVSYQTATSVADATLFYEEELAAAGWTKNEDDSFTTSDAAILSFEQDGATLSVTISADPNTGNTVVLIIEE